MEHTDPRRPIPPPAIADRFGDRDLASAFAQSLAGRPADGSAPARPSSELTFGSVIWIDRGDEVLVHLDSLRAQTLDRTLLVSVDLETDQTGRSPLVVVLALGKIDDPAGLVAVTDDLPRGNGLLASRWGRILQDAVWASLMALAADHARERGLAPHGVAVTAGTLLLTAGAPPSILPAASGEVTR